MSTLLLYATLLLVLCVSTETSWAKTIVETLPGFPGKLPFKFETGYIGLGESESKQIFYYFFESEQNPNDDPLILFLTGGPGCSGLSDIIAGIGPFAVTDTISDDSIPTLKLNPYSWSKLSNLLVIDQPVGTGYSYGKTVEDYLTNDTQSAHLIYQFLKKWLMNHPEYLPNPLYIGGGSYAGIWVPLVVQVLYQGNEDQDDTPLNIKGYILGNPMTDKYGDLNSRIKYAHRMGLLSDILYESAKSNCKGNYLINNPDNVLCKNDLEKINKCLDKICQFHILQRSDCGSALTKFPTISSNLLLPSNEIDGPLIKLKCAPDQDMYKCIWANNKTVQEALHIRKGTITQWVRCNRTLVYTDLSERTETYVFEVETTVPIHQYLTSKRARALIYSGDHDMAFPHISTEEWINSLRLKVESDWRPWFVEEEVAGYTMKYAHQDYELTYATIKGGSHVSLESNPKECFSMITKWFAGETL